MEHVAKAAGRMLAKGARVTPGVDDDVHTVNGARAFAAYGLATFGALVACGEVRA